VGGGVFVPPPPVAFGVAWWVYLLGWFMKR